MMFKLLVLSFALNVILNATFVRLSSIPIWEFLSREEKLRRIFAVLVHSIDLSCLSKPSPDCERTLTLHGASSLLQKDDNILDLLDPYHRLGQQTIWKSLMEPKYTFPYTKTQVVIENQPILTTKFHADRRKSQPKIINSK